MKRRTFLRLSAAGAAGASVRPALAHYQSVARPQSEEDLGAIVARLRSRFTDTFDAAYVDHVILPHFNVFEDLLRKVWAEEIEFVKLNIANPEPLPIGPNTVIGDNVGFVRSA